MSPGPITHWMGDLLHRLKLSLFTRPIRHAQAPKVSLLDLLGRRAINLDTPELQRFLGGKRVLVTGAGGSIGSEICRQTMKFCPKSLIMLDRCENALFEIDQELRDRWLGADLRPMMADICDRTRIEQILADEQPQVVFHAAAHKHVPMMEHNPGEAIKNNVFGTRIVADASRSAGVGAFVMISTDKAVNPTSVMGATKRVAELYVQSLNCQPPAADLRLSSLGNRKSAIGSSQTRFVAVRFGNVLGSSGSVVPIFQRQIAAGGPVTVTHSEMRRYFMTIPEASQLVMQAGAIGQGGEIFVLNMGEPVKILDLAHEMIRRHGLVIGKDIEVRITGMRPGEKLFEELANDTDQTAPTAHPKIGVWKLPRYSHAQATEMLNQLAGVTQSSRDAIIATLMQAVPEYQPGNLPAPRGPVLVTEAA
ncbi:MAG: polysaccharide biosynthesis protein [Burkholderiales bacterium]|nr:polysaccharide biosynthesis protein [Phycisphaerae bacterium]